MRTVLALLTRVFQILNASLGHWWRNKCRPVLIAARPYWHRLKFLLHCFKFETFGQRCSLAGPVRVLGKTRIRLGQHVAFRSHITIGGHGLLEIGDHSVINDYCIISAYKQVCIGHHVMLAPYVYVLDIDHAFADKQTPISQQGYETAAVTIEDGVWIGTQSIITRGVTIGQNSIVAANSVVTRDIPPNSIAAGNPAVVVKHR